MLKTAILRIQHSYIYRSVVQKYKKKNILYGILCIRNM